MQALFSPRGGKNKKSKLPTPEDVKLSMKKHIMIAKELDEQQREAYSNKGKKEKAGESQAGKAAPFQINEIRSLKTANYKVLSKFSTLYRKSYQLARADRVGTANSAFSSPVIVGDVLVNFFRGADLGNLPGTSTPVQNVLSFVNPAPGQPPIASRSILASALSLYAKRHRLYRNSRENVGKQEDQMNRQVIGADNHMQQTLAPLFIVLEQRSAAKLAAEGKRDGDRKPPAKRVRKYFRADGVTRIWNDFEHAFDRSNFSYSAFQSLFSSGGVIDAKAKKENPNITPVDFENFKISKEVGTRYMTEMSALKEAVKQDPRVLENPQNNPVAIANRASGGNPDLALQTRAALDTVHSLISSASAQYDQVKPKKKAAKRV